MHDIETEGIIPKTITALVAARLREMMLAGELKPGTRIKQSALAERLKVSRTPVREAFRILVSEGMIEEIPYRGAFVADMNPDAMRHIFQVRQILEGFAVETATPVLPETELEAVTRLLAKVGEEMENGIYDRYFESDVAVHSLFVNNCGNPYLALVLSELNRRIHAIRAFSGRRPGEQMRRSHEEHKRVIQAAQRGEASAARRYMETHLKDSCERVIGLVKQFLEERKG